MRETTVCLYVVWVGKPLMWHRRERTRGREVVETVISSGEAR